MEILLIILLFSVLMLLSICFLEKLILDKNIKDL